MENHMTVLVEIPDSKLPQLYKLYKNSKSCPTYMSTFIKTAIEWKKSEKFRNLLHFYSPYNTWEEDGTIIVETEVFFAKDIYVFSLESNAGNIIRGLEEVRRLIAKSASSFYAASHKQVPAIEKYLNKKGHDIEHILPCYFYELSISEAEQFTIECPSDMYLDRINGTHGPLVNDRWPHNFPNSVNYISTLLEANGGWGLFLRKNNQLVAWILRHLYGMMAMVQVEEEYQGKGYGTLVIKKLAQEMAEEGLPPTVTILPTNYKSIKVFEKLGFRQIDHGQFTLIKN